MRSVDVLVIGAGVSGLTVAHQLAQRGHVVEVWEEKARPGGKIATREVDGYRTEQAASIMLASHPDVTRLLEQCGLYEARTPRSAIAAANRYLVCGQQLMRLPMGFGAMLRSPLWSLPAKLRLLVEPLIPRGGHEGETVSQFITRRLGREMLEKAIEPYVAGTLASDVDEANAHAVLPRLTALERRYGSLGVGVLAHKMLRRRTACAAESFSFPGGMGSLVSRLATALGPRLRSTCAAQQVRPDRGGWCVVGRSPQAEQTVRARQLVLSVPADVAAALLAPLDRNLSQLLDGIVYAPLSVVHFGLDRSAVHHPLDGIGFLVPRQAGIALSGNLWMSSLFPDRAPQGKVLLSCYLGGTRCPEAVEWSDERSIDQAMAGLRRFLDLRGDPEMVHIDRHEQALPLYHGAYPQRLRAIASRLQTLPGLHLAANYWGGVSVSDRMISGCATALRIEEALRSGVDSRTCFAGSLGLAGGLSR